MKSTLLSRRKEETHFQKEQRPLILMMIISPEETENVEMQTVSLIQLTLTSLLVQMIEDQRTSRRELETLKLVKLFASTIQNVPLSISTCLIQDTTTIAGSGLRKAILQMVPQRHTAS